MGSYPFEAMHLPTSSHASPKGRSKRTVRIFLQGWAAVPGAIFGQRRAAPESPLGLHFIPHHFATLSMFRAWPADEAFRLRVVQHSKTIALSHFQIISVIAHALRRPALCHIGPLCERVPLTSANTSASQMTSSSSAQCCGVGPVGLVPLLLVCGEPNFKHYATRTQRFKRCSSMKRTATSPLKGTLVTSFMHTLDPFYRKPTGGHLCRMTFLHHL